MTTSISAPAKQFGEQTAAENVFKAALEAPEQDPRALTAAFMQRYSIQLGGPGAPERFVREISLQRWGNDSTGRLVHLGWMPDPEDPEQPAVPDEFQCTMLGWYGAGERNIAVKSGHGVGKTTGLSWICEHQLLTRFPQKIAITAPSSSQLFDALFPELCGWITRLPPFLRDTLKVTSDRIELISAPDESYLTARTSRPEMPEALAGIHSEYVLLIGDEASGIPEPVFEAASGSMSSKNAITILAGNPVRVSGLFFDIFNKEGMDEVWKRLTMSCLDSRRVTKKYIADMARRYGPESNAYRVRVLGEFPVSGQDTIISYESVATAEGRDIRVNPVSPVVWGLDVARFGGDKSALCVRKGNAILGQIETWDDLDLMQLATVIHAKFLRTDMPNRPSEILIDSIGVGAGVVDRLRQLNLPAFGINVSESAAMSEHYLNLRAELWFMGKEWFARKDVTFEKQGTADNESDFISGLTRTKYKFTKTGKFQAESKDEMKKRGFESPNEADAFLLTLASTANVMINGQSLSWNQPLRRNIKGAEG